MTTTRTFALITIAAALSSAFLFSQEKKISRSEKTAKTDPKIKAELEVLTKCRQHLEQGKNIRHSDEWLAIWTLIRFRM